jgi:two-component system, OmpR family, phosphate regulon sensor histidine kinase PhoR
MKNRNTVLLFGSAAIIILISVQVFLISNTWKQKSEMFDLRYKTLSQDFFSRVRRFDTNVGFDTALFLVNVYADSIIRKELHPGISEKRLDSLKQQVLNDVLTILYREQDLSQFLSSYFERRGYEKNFNYKIEINDLQLIDFEKRIDIYQNPNILLARRGGAPNIRTANQNVSSRILVNPYSVEDNFFRMRFDYFIDFKDKQKMVLRETAASLGMSGLTIIVVVLLFMYTYRNLMEERRLSNLKTDFINNMTHELKTPLSTITVAGKTLEMKQIRSDESKIVETAKLIGKQSVHLNQLINLILEISMWERTQFQLDKKTVEIEGLLKDIVDSFKTGNGAVISQNYDLKGIFTNLDVVYFTTMINNLLSNAVKYSDKKPEIIIDGTSDKEHIYIKISDNGIGISKQDQKHIFDKFYRVTHGNIHKFKGLGLGLYYVKRIAESHGGDVSVDSKPGKGSIFTITLPY